MSKTCAGRQLARFWSRKRWLVSAVLAAFIMSGHAYAREVTDNGKATFLAGSFNQNDSIWSGRTDVISNLPSGFTTFIAVQPGLLFEQDHQTVALSAALVADDAFAAPYYVMIKNVSAGTLRYGAGLIRAADGAAITTVLPNVPFSVPATPAVAGLVTLGDAPNPAKVEARSEVSAASTSFLEQLSVPEPGTVGLLGTGFAALTGAVRRRNSK